MIDRLVVQEALRHSWELDDSPGFTPVNPVVGQDSIISLLIHDIFGAEILKTHKKKGWHFYNRLDGERIDFAGTEMGKFSDEDRFEDIPSTPDETYSYFEEEDYSSFLMRFVRAFEEAVGLEKYRSEYAA